MKSDIYEWASQYGAFNKWMRHKSLSPKTMNKYAASLKVYSDFRGMDPDELAKEVESLGPLKAEEAVAEELVLFQEHLLQMKLSDGTPYAHGSIKAFVVSMQSFYSTVFGHRVQIPTRVNAKIKKLRQHIPTRHELNKILSCCNLKEKTIILFQATTGFRIGDMLALKIRDVEGIFDDTTEYLPIKYLAEKTGSATGERITVVPPCTIEILREYLRMRAEAGEELQSNSPLFVSNKKDGKPITSVQVNNILKSAVRKSGILTPMQLQDGVRVTSHKLRSYFINWLTQGGMPKYYVEYMAGHTVEYNGAYFDVNAQILVDEYRKYVNAVDPFFDEEKQVALDDVKSLTDKITYLAQRVDNIESGKTNEVLSEALAKLLDEVNRGDTKEGASCVV